MMEFTRNFFARLIRISCVIIDCRIREFITTHKKMAFRQCVLLLALLVCFTVSAPVKQSTQGKTQQAHNSQHGAQTKQFHKPTSSFPKELKTAKVLHRAYELTQALDTTVSACKHPSTWCSNLLPDQQTQINTGVQSIEKTVRTLAKAKNTKELQAIITSIDSQLSTVAGMIPKSELSFPTSLSMTVTHNK
jgi:hypothetical protein